MPQDRSGKHGSTFGRSDPLRLAERIGFGFVRANSGIDAMTEAEIDKWIDGQGCLFREDKLMSCAVCGSETFVYEDVGLPLPLCSPQCQESWWRGYYRAACRVPDGVLMMSESSIEEIEGTQ